MRFRRLFLERFGHFDNVTIDLGPKPSGAPDFVVLYGLNEAGKSTLMAGLLRLLYGFQRSDPYTFGHGPESKIGAEIEGLAGHPTVSVFRLKSGNALMDGNGRSLGAGFFDPVLGGLSDRDHRRLFSLDRDSVIEGSKELSEGKGDAARAFFAAHTGLARLTSQLTGVEEAAQALFRPAGRKHQAATLLRDIKALQKEARDADLTPASYAAQRRQTRAAIKESDAKEQALSTLRTEVDQIDRLIRLRDDLAQLSDRQRQLASYGELPNWEADPHPTALIELVGQMGALEADLTHKRAALETVGARIEAAGDPDPVLTVAERLGVLRDNTDGMSLHDGAIGASNHLLKRAQEADAQAQVITRRLDAVRREAGGPLPDALVLDAEPLAALQRAEAAFARGEDALEQAKQAFGKAQQRLEELRRDRADDLAPQILSPEAIATLERDDPAATLDAAKTAERDIEQRAVAFNEALAAIQTAGRPFVEVPETDLSPASVRATTQRLAAHRQAAAEASARAATLGDEIDRLQDDLTRLQRAMDPDLEDPVASRAQRDAVWAKHRAALDPASASAFETEMLRHDGVTERRFAQSATLGKINEMAASLDAKRRDRQREAGRAEAAIAEAQIIEDAHAATLADMNLPRATTMEELGDWLEALRRVRVAATQLDEAKRRGAGALRHAAAVAEGLRRLLPDLTGAEDDRVLSSAASLLFEHGLKAEARRTAQAQFTRATADLATAKEAVAEAEHRASTLATVWRDIVAANLPADHNLRDPRHSLEALDTVAKLGVTWRSLLDRCDAMRRDARAYLAALSAIDEALGTTPTQFEPALQDAELVERTRQGMAREAELAERLRQAQAERARLAEDLKLRTALGQEIDDLTRQTDQIRNAIETYRAPFPPSVDTSTHQALERAVTNAKEATRLRREIARITETLGQALEATDWDDLTTAANALVNRNLDTERSTLVVRVDQAEEGFRAAYAAASIAQDRLNGLGGSDAAAKAHALCAAKEEQLAETLLTAARKQIGLLLARAAIDNYRRENRSAAMQAAADAFRGLTHGRYADLSSRSEDGLEKLIATRAADGAERVANELSAGTRMQLFFALRIAAYRDIVNRGVRCPFIADDVFESFDDYRTSAACEAMRDLGDIGQSIYLTHHADVAQKAIEAADGHDVVRFMPGVPDKDQSLLRARDHSPQAKDVPSTLSAS